MFRRYNNSYNTRVPWRRYVEIVLGSVSSAVIYTCPFLGVRFHRRVASATVFVFLFPPSVHSHYNSSRTSLHRFAVVCFPPELGYMGAALFVLYDKAVRALELNSDLLVI